MEIDTAFVAPLLDYITHLAEYVRSNINDVCSGLESWQIIAFTFATTLLTVYIWEFLFQEKQSLLVRIKKSFFKNIKKIPFIKAKIDRELAPALRGMDETFNPKSVRDQGYIQELPEKGISEEEVLKSLQTYKSLADVDWSKGACSGTVYNGEKRLTNLMAKVYGEFAWTNPLHADVFPDVRKMEAEVVRMTCNMFNGDSETCGCMTSGGTESIMLACKAFRDMAYERGVTFPEMLVPHTVHAAFDKAAYFFNMKITHIPVDEKTRMLDVKAMRRAINSSTCMLVGSAPSFPHGVIDPIEEISKLGLAYNLPVHVDSCLGGFLVPFMEEAGFSLPLFDFRLPGVTSISADTHKYGFAPKGSSVLCYKNTDYRRYQYFLQPDWPGGIYASPTFAGSRPGAIIAACWSTMMLYGRLGYVDSTQKIISTARMITEELRKMDGIFIYGEPLVSVIGIGSTVFDIYRLSDALTKRGWNLNALQFPSSIHLCVTLVHTQAGVAERFVQDIREELPDILNNPKSICEGAGAMYGMAQSIPDRSLVGAIAGHYFDAYYSTKTVEPTQNGVKHKG